jgi:Flp pilus assembly protein TadG
MAQRAFSNDGGNRARRASPVRRLARRFLRIRRDQRGVSVVEFALFVPILALMILGTIDLARGLAADFRIEQAAQRTIELATLGNRPLADYSFLRTEAATAAGVPVANVTLDQWLECNNTRQASFAGACTAGQQTARYITITVFTDYTPMFEWIPFIGRVATASNGKIRLTADSGVRVQ